MSTPDSTHLVPTDTHPPDPIRGPLLRPLKAASATAYSKDMRQFYEVFKGGVPCDQRTVERYIASLRNRVGATTIYRRLMSLRHEHVRLGHPSPTDLPAIRPLLRQLQKGILPPKPGAKPAAAPKRSEPRQAKPITRSLLAKMLDAMGTNVIDRRDRCLLLLGFSAALSRSALVSLDAGDLVFTNDVMVLHLREFDDRAAAPRVITVPITGHEMCAATATRSYLQHAALDIEGGPLLRSCDRAGDLTPHRLHPAWISVVVKNRLRSAGIDHTQFSGLSLRRGRLLEMARGTL